MLITYTERGEHVNAKEREGERKGEDGALYPTVKTAKVRWPDL